MTQVFSPPGWTEQTYQELRASAAGAQLLAILPIGAIEAHGPHLAMGTDNVIAEAMAREGARQLAKEGVVAWVLPTLPFTAAPFAANFPGTLSFRAETVVALLLDLAQGLERSGVEWLVFANAHLDPTHLQALYDAIGRIHAETKVQVIFPDITRKPWALELTDEFRSGACHAGCYETSIVLAERPEWVREPIRQSLSPNPESLSRAIWRGQRSFEEAGGPEAYFGDPAAASPQEGHTSVAALGAILARSVLASQPTGRS